MSKELVKCLDLASLPFYIGLVEPTQCSDVPSSLPFSMEVHPQYAIPRLIVTEEIRAALNLAYSKGSMCSTPLGESSLAKVRMNEILDKILELFDGVIKDKTFLEVGCGNGELLNQLKEMGAIVTGLEIGPQADVVEKRYGIKVVRSHLSEETFTTKFDCILSYGCLEHIEDLATFFSASRACLKENGLYLHSVPNAELSFSKVSLDHLLHEHINYFTPKNGLALLMAQGFRSGGFALSRPGNELMLWGYLDTKMPIGWPEECVEREEISLKVYAEKLSLTTGRVVKSLESIVNSNRSLGFYSGGYQYGFQLHSDGIRYFDSDSYKHGKCWLSGLPPIETPSSLIEAPVDCLVICKPHYFTEISRDLIGLGVDPASIINIDALANDF